MILHGLQPERVFYYFEQICAIPHGSGNTKAISDWCMAQAARLGLAAEQDALNNVIIRKKGSAGKEDRPTVILQGHLDMVCQKAEGVDLDFATDGLRLQRDGEYLTADGTTLGADDGIAVAMIFAILEDETSEHPPLEALFTVEEETGMDGAAGLDGSRLQGRRLINIDSEEEGVLTVGCAGGLRADISLEMIPTALAAPCYQVEIGGLLGGHSGMMIHTGRHNAGKLMAELLSRLSDGMLVSLYAGEKDNVICNACTAVVSTREDIAALAAAFVKEKYLPQDPGLFAQVTPLDGEVVGYDSISTAAALQMLRELPNGVQTMSKDVAGLVQTSLNLGTLRLEEDCLKVSFSLRSSVGAEKQALFERLLAIAHKHGARVGAHGDYPAWEYRKDSPLRDKMAEIFTRLYGKAPQVLVIHAGLECGLLGEKLPDIDAVSIGPDILDIHSPAERLHIPSTARTYEFLREILKEL
ncbi:MAG: aminoacyl-histidine dipeptidase [Clostridia bacterium]|nr:aminoacyl-histidine dipeptidase [Clostridia bacterium]